VASVRTKMGLTVEIRSCKALFYLELTIRIVFGTITFRK
jgi:hypothetical protein